MQLSLISWLRTWKAKSSNDFMRFLIFLPPNDFKDESVAMVKTFFDRWSVEYKITSYANKECVGYHGARYMPDVNTNKVSTNDFDGIILIDGKGVDTYKLYEFRPLLDILLLFNEKNKIIGAINNSIKIVARANIVKDRKISMPKDEELRRLVILFHGTPSDESIEISKNIITIKDSQGLEGPLTTMLQHIGAI